MKREDVKNKIPGITEEQLNWIMAENGNDVNREKTAAEQYKTQLETPRLSSRPPRTALPPLTARRSPRNTRQTLPNSRAICRHRLRALPLTMP